MTPGPLQTQFLAKLRDGTIPQITNSLQSDAGACVFGVACIVLNVTKVYDEDSQRFLFEDEHGSYGSSVPESVRRALRLTQEGIDKLMSLNDAGYTFVQLADLIDEAPSDFFIAPA